MGTDPAGDSSTAIVAVLNAHGLEAPRATQLK